MAILFENFSIGNLTLENRIIRSATWEGMCEKDGQPTGKLIDTYLDLVAGGIGLIISGYTYVRPEGKQNPGKMGIYSDSFKDSFTTLTNAVHQANGKIAIQLVHAGGQATTKTAGRQPVAPSGKKTALYRETPMALSVLEIEAITDAFAQSARRAKAWGFDAVQIHGAHGYLVNQFLSPFTNQRTDQYGGSLENRSRFLIQIYEKIRSQVGREYPLFIKINGDDFVKNGFSNQEAVEVCRHLSHLGIDAIEVSGGSGASGKLSPARTKINAPEDEAYNLEIATSIKAAVSCPVICVGGIRSHTIARRIVESDGLDAVSLSRPLIREPDLVLKWQNNETDTCGCISCNKCFMPGLTKGGIYCVPLKKEQGDP
jgi:2,4-dienoyl-CoA reductase-like NADH-dependent reductase (Old Yellow Enzyme family)